MEISLYTTPNCPQCRMSKKMLDESGVEYQIIDLSQDAKSLEMVRNLGYASAPVIIAGGAHWSGFRHDRLLNAISQYRLNKYQAA